MRATMHGNESADMLPTGDSGLDEHTDLKVKTDGDISRGGRLTTANAVELLLDPYDSVAVDEANPMGRDQ